MFQLTTVAVSFLAACMFPLGSTATEVTLPSGATVIGLTSENQLVDSFLGIQYAKVGERFSRSTLIERIPSSETINATQFGPNCHQVYVGVANFIHQPREEQEECLYLNIWRPSNTTADKLATMVWIHGGGFALGSGADQVNVGANLAAEQGVIVVTINYRLGPLGFLPQDESGTGGMNGIYDQIIALQWIQNYISSFGGDPKKVTIFGESAGGESVCMLAVSPRARGLFQRAIMQSGECVNNNWIHGIPNDNVEYGFGLLNELLNITGAASVDNLKNKTVFAAADINMISPMVGFPVITLDREILPFHPRELYQDPNNIVPLEMIVGANTYEDAMFLAMSPEQYLGLASTGIQDTAAMVLGEQGVDLALDAYNASRLYNGNQAAAYAQFVGDYYIRCPTREFATIVADAGVKVYLYNFAHFSIIDPVVHSGLSDLVDTTGWASHLAEIPFVFGTMSSWIPISSDNATEATNSSDLSSADVEMSREIQTRWAHFAMTGNPNALGLTEWDEVMASDDTNAVPPMVFQGGQGRMMPLPEKARQCSIFPYVAKSDTPVVPTDRRTKSPTASPKIADASTAFPTSSSSAAGSRMTDHHWKIVMASASIMLMFTCLV